MFWLAPHPELPAPQRGSPRMFRPAFIERHLSRVRPLQVLVVWVPVVAYFQARAFLDPNLSAVAAVGLFGAGLFAWTLLEYALHRLVFHFRASPASELQRDLAYLIHGVHHDYPYDADRLVMPPLVAVILALVVGIPMHAVLGATYFAPAFAGLVAGYIWYDMTHFAVHHLKQRTAFGRLQKRAHFVHHFARHDRLFGVTSPLWDFVFGTWVPEAGRRSVDRATEPTGTASAKSS